MNRMEQSRLSLRIDLPNGDRFGPGKAALLRAIIVSGSIRGAADDLNMSYPRALKLIEQMNQSFASPLLSTQHGGAAGGGAEVTALGQQVLKLYDEICVAAATASQEHLRDIEQTLAK